MCKCFHLRMFDPYILLDMGADIWHNVFIQGIIAHLKDDALVPDKKGGHHPEVRPTKK